MCNLNDWRKNERMIICKLNDWRKLLKINKQTKQQQQQRQTLLKKPSLDKTLLKNYHPIFNLLFLLKILDIFFHKLLSHLQENLSNPFQSAYRAGHSTETVLLRVIYYILCALDNDNISVLLLLDLYAAFDTVDHQILLSRLNSVFGIQSTALQWFQSYLSDRYQSTLVNNSSSSPSQLMYGLLTEVDGSIFVWEVWLKPLECSRLNAKNRVQAGEENLVVNRKIQQKKNRNVVIVQSGENIVYHT